MEMHDIAGIRLVFLGQWKSMIGRSSSWADSTLGDRQSQHENARCIFNLISFKIYVLLMTNFGSILSWSFFAPYLGHAFHPFNPTEKRSTMEPENTWVPRLARSKFRMVEYAWCDASHLHPYLFRSLDSLYSTLYSIYFHPAEKPTMSKVIVPLYVYPSLGAWSPLEDVYVSSILALTLVDPSSRLSWFFSLSQYGAKKSDFLFF